MSFPQFYDCRLEDDRQLPMEPGRKEGREMHFVHLGPGLASLPYYLSRYGWKWPHSLPCSVLTSSVDRAPRKTDVGPPLPADLDCITTEHNPASNKTIPIKKVKTKPLLSVGDCALLAWHGAAVLASITHRSPPWIPASPPRVPRLCSSSSGPLAPYYAVFLLQSPTISSAGVDTAAAHDYHGPASIFLSPRPKMQMLLCIEAHFAAAQRDGRAFEGRAILRADHTGAGEAR
ncbi:hypothetical protein K456DRAFT_71652 [Colletotrichum gloeosporioides 23]|nr:hypothetical protein K456DRAFT_71652 [Colletotrichum gloeosporioides 23]